MSKPPHVATKAEKRRANAQVARAVKDGRLIRKVCERCGFSATVAHHDDYARPLDVRWLCWGCHEAWHKAHRLSLGRRAKWDKSLPEILHTETVDSPNYGV